MVIPARYVNLVLRPIYRNEDWPVGMFPVACNKAGSLEFVGIV